MGQPGELSVSSVQSVVISSKAVRRFARRAEPGGNGLALRRSGAPRGLPGNQADRVNLDLAGAGPRLGEILLELEAPVGARQTARWRKGHPLKVSLAARLRAETTVTLDWIAKRLRMGTRGHLAHLIYLHEHARSEPPPQDQPRLNI